VSAPRRHAALGHGDLAASLVFIFPLFLFYGVGVLFADTINGVDFITRLLVAAVGYDADRYLAVYGVLAAAYLALLLVARRRSPAALSSFLPMLLESAIYALTLGTLILFVMQHVPGLGVGLGVGLGGDLGGLLAVADGQGIGAWEALVISSGAGVHEELIFRLGIMAGGAAALIALGAPRVPALLFAALISAVLFSGAHHLGPLGDPFSLDVFTYRLLAGLMFAAIFYFRSLAHAVYAHFLYDVYVLLLNG
jgi:hypothetical protein